MADPVMASVQPVLPTRDMQTAIAFYTERLGFTIGFADAAENPDYVGLRRNHVELHLQTHDPSEWDRVERPLIRFVVPEVDALYEEFKNSGGLNDHSQVRDTDWGTREFGLYDPDGNGLVFYGNR